MIHVLRCIVLQHDLRLVGLAVVLSLFASATAMTMIARGRAARGRQRDFWLVVGGTIAGCGIWGLHFVAMLAYRANMPVAYDIGETVASAVIAAVLCALGFRLALSRFGVVLGGMVTGIAICMMHYVGMAAMRVPARIEMDTHYVVASVVFGIVMSTIALWVALRRANLRSYALGAGLLAIATAGMHFTAMSAMRLVPDAHAHITGAVLAPAMLAVAVAAGVLLIMALGLTGALVDQHLARRAQHESEVLREHVSELERTQAQLETTSQELREALARAEIASDAKTQFLAVMSHELRTPLNAVIGFSEILQTEMYGALGDTRYRDYADNIHGSANHLLSLINNILDLTRLDSRRIELRDEILSLSELVAGVARMMDAQAAEVDVTIAVQFEDDDLQIHGDGLRLRQVLIHLVSNAIKFTHAGGRVALRVWQMSEAVVIAVTDTGIGIAAGDLSKAFEPFGQVDGGLSRRYEGTGLGLPLARRLVELHGGTLMLVSAPGVGTTASIRLPLSRVVQDAATSAVA